jgi:hypothetical protein
VPHLQDGSRRWLAAVSFVTVACAVLHCVLHTYKQRQLEYEALYSLDYLDVELVEDEQWGRVLVAQRDFARGEVVVRSSALFQARTVAKCVRECHTRTQASIINSRIMAQYLQWAAGSPR